MKVLIVDDNTNDRKLLRLIMERHDFKEIMEACDGLDGLRMAKERKPDLIISDALMPRLDGFQFLWTLNLDEELRKIPFVFHSAVYTGLKDEELALQLGAEGFIARPKEPVEFWQELGAILENIANGKRNPRPPRLMTEEREYLRHYCEIVTVKLEEKVRDLEENLARRKAAEEEAAAYRERLKALAAELAHAEEREGERIAVELHDTVGQCLAHMKMKLDALTSAPALPEVMGPINEVHRNLVTVIEQLRSLTFRISPPVLRLIGFEAAVESLCEKFHDDFGISFVFSSEGKSCEFGEDLRGGLYRMVRELLFNAVKHAKAEMVNVSVKNSGGRVAIRVEDNGCGFDAQHIFQNEDKRTCLGLFSIKERIEYLGGSMHIDSGPGRGTRVELILSLENSIDKGGM